MALQIKDTPILRGNDAKRFSAEVKENASKKVSAGDYQRAMAVYDKVIVRGYIQS